MKPTWVVAVWLLVVVGAHADPSDLGGGVFVAHNPPGLQFTNPAPQGGWCRLYLDHHAINTCAEQVNRIDTWDPVVWFVLAAWSEDKEWCGTEFGFGQYEESAFLFTDHGACYPEEGLEIPTAGWPGPNEGLAFVVTGTDAWSGNFVPVYYFVGYAYSEDVIPLAANPSSNFGGAGNCSTPPTKWSADAFGGMGLFTDGIYACPQSGPGGFGPEAGPLRTRRNGENDLVRVPLWEGRFRDHPGGHRRFLRSEWTHD